MTWLEGKSEGFREILRHDKRNRNAICGLWRSIKYVEMLSETSILKNVNVIRRGIFKIYEQTPETPAIILNMFNIYVRSLYFSSSFRQDWFFSAF